jgi:diguanylate cyclase (GGDEF)-like protein
MVGAYDFKLVALSLAIAIVASYTALDLAGRVNASSGRRLSVWLAGGALSMGTGIWAMHFIGMLAFHLPIPVAYDSWLNALSWLIAALVSAIALFVVQRPTMTGGNLSIGATVMGIGISLMHYTGMAAMQMSPPISYSPPWFVASVMIGIGASLAALWIAFKFRKVSSRLAIFGRLGSAGVMGLAITGMHYTGMAAAEFAPDSMCLATGSSLGISSSAIAVIIAVATAAILSVTLILSAVDAQIAVKNASHAATLEATNTQLRNIALYDHLTGLPNRLLLDDRVEQAILHASRSGKHCGLMFVDLDKFKPVNDTFGHQVGDELLRAVAGRMKHSLRKGDTVARSGGDEFIVVLNELDEAKDAAVVGAKVLTDLARPFAIEGHLLNISCSIGISMYPDHGTTLKELMSRADVAMYQAKKAGRNNCLFFEHAMEQLTSPNGHA